MLNVRACFVGVVSALVVLAICGDFTEASTRSIPPLFQETPNARVNPLPRADEDNYRLPNQTEPIHYDVTLKTNVHNGEKLFVGTVKIDIRVLQATEAVVLHARELKINSANAKLTGNAAAPNQELVNTYETAREFLTLTPKNSGIFAANSLWTLTIEYEGQLRTDNGGFYLSTYTDEDNKIHNLATTQFESTDARHGFPCYDEPAKRATFTITIHHDASYNAISNMPVDQTKSIPGTTVFQQTVKQSTYLIAFIVSDFKWTEGVLNSLGQRIYSRPGTEHDQEWALVSGMLITERLASYYDVKFSLPKLDQVAVPDFAAGAMENWGLVTYREEYLLYNPKTSTISTQTNVANIIAHEYTHQWFGNLVAIKWWMYLWLKEGFATLFSWQATDAAYPEWDAYQLFHTDDYQRALVADGTGYSRPMTYYVQKPNDISRLYDSISYSKAGSVLHMFQHALTDEVFQLGLHNYLTVKGYDAAEESDLFTGIQNAAKELGHKLEAQIDPMMSSWTRQAGFPLLTVTRNYDDGSFTVKQQAYYDDTSSSTNHLWYVPINYVSQANPDFRNTTATDYLLNVAEIKINSAKLAKDDWLILNKQSTGYYRINYDEQNWRLIAEGLRDKPHKIHPRNRAQLMHDAYRFSSNGRIPHNVLFHLMLYLRAENQYAPWSTASSIFNIFNRYLSGDKDYVHFKTFVSDLVGEVYEQLGVNDVPGEQHLQKFTRNLAINLACLVGVEDCLQETNKKLTSQINDGTIIEPNLQSSTYCNGLRKSKDMEYNYVYDLLMSSKDQAQRRLLISALGCSETKSHLEKFVKSSIEPNSNTNTLRTQERTTLLSAAYSRGEVGLMTSIEFLNDNWEAYGDLTYGGLGAGRPLNDAIVGMSQYVVNTEQEKKLTELVDKVKHSDKVSTNLETSVKNNIGANMDWLASNRDPIMNYMHSYTRDGSMSISASFLSIAVALAVVVVRLF